MLEDMRCWWGESTWQQRLLAAATVAVLLAPMVAHGCYADALVAAYSEESAQPSVVLKNSDGTYTRVPQDVYEKAKEDYEERTAR